MGIVTCIYVNHPIFLYSMNSHNQSYDIRSLPKEMQETILMSKDWGLLHATINFLGIQPTTLAEPRGHTSPIESIVLYGDIAETKSVYSWEGWQATLWNIHTGEHIHTKIEPYKPWENEGSAVLCGDKAINIMYKYDSSEPVMFHSTGVWDIHTGQQLDKIKHDNDVESLTAHDNYVALVLHNGLVKIWNINDKDDTRIIDPISKATSVAIIKDNIIIGTRSGDLEMRNIHTLFLPHNAFDKDVIHWFVNTTNRPNKVTSITVYQDKILAGHRDGTTKIWDMLTWNLLHTLAGPNEHTASITSIVMDSDIVITGSKDCTVKIWPLKVNYLGTPNNNPLLWIIYNTNIPQLNFIWRAYEATQAEKEFVISLPKKLGIIEEDESSEQTYGRIYFTLPQFIREYLRNRLTIRRAAQTVIEKSYLAYKEDNCSIM